jgi:hypothetical protein
MCIAPGTPQRHEVQQRNAKKKHFTAGPHFWARIRS